ncbi:MAG: complex I NDUFA9 subunit family protein [Rhodospirillales bacterium]|nr:complex I NDUFA9 subunit family protein [Rhodospirillales bacterium]
MNKKIVTVFGGSGFVGRHLVRRLCAEGAIVRVAVRDPEQALFLKPIGDVGQINAVAADVANPESVAAAVAGASAVVNLVGRLSGNKKTFERLHVTGAAIVAKAAAEAGVQSLVHLSAIGADPQSKSHYARTKAEGEAAVTDVFPGAVILRPSVIFGPEDKFFNLFAGLARFTVALPVLGAPAIPRLSIFKDDALVDIDMFGDGGCRFQPVYVGNVADAIMRALEDQDARAQVYELGGPQVFSAKEIMELLLTHIGRRRILFPAPFWWLTTIAWFLEKSFWPLLTRDQVILLRTQNVISEGAKTLADLGVQPTPADAVLPGYLDRFRLVRERHLRSV